MDEQDKPYTIFARLDDPKLTSDFKATLKREDRSMQAVVERALRAYVAQSKAHAAALEAAEASAQKA